MRLFSSWTSDDFVKRITLLQAFTAFALAIICFSSIGILPSSAVDWQKVGGWAGVAGGVLGVGVGIAGLGVTSPVWFPVAGIVGGVQQVSSVVVLHLLMHIAINATTVTVQAVAHATHQMMTIVTTVMVQGITRTVTIVTPAIQTIQMAVRIATVGGAAPVRQKRHA